MFRIRIRININSGDIGSKDYYVLLILEKNFLSYDLTDFLSHTINDRKLFALFLTNRICIIFLLLSLTTLLLIKDRVAILVDDMADTCGTICLAAEK